MNYGRVWEHEHGRKHAARSSEKARKTEELEMGEDQRVRMVGIPEEKQRPPCQPSPWLDVSARTVLSLAVDLGLSFRYQLALVSQCFVSVRQ